MVAGILWEKLLSNSRQSNDRQLGDYSSGRDFYPTKGNLIIATLGDSKHSNGRDYWATLGRLIIETYVYRYRHLGNPRHSNVRYFL